MSRTPEEIRLYSREYYHKNKEKLNKGRLDRTRKFRASKKGKKYFKEYSASYYQENKEIMIAQALLRYYKKKLINLHES